MNQSEQPEVSIDAVLGVAGMLENRAKATAQKHLVEDPTIQTRKQLVDGLKQGQIPGTAMIEWDDNKGRVRLSVIDFLVESKAKAIDPDTGETIVIPPREVRDGTWRVLY